MLAPSSEEPDAIAAACRDHLQGCKAQVVSDDGNSHRLLVSNATDQLWVSFNDGVVIALRAERSQWKEDRMGELMSAAESRSKKFMQ